MLFVDETRMTRDAVRHGFAVGAAVLETRMLDRAAYERLLDAPTLAEQRRIVSRRRTPDTSACADRRGRRTRPR
jgi:hypothetical protein